MSLTVQSGVLDVTQNSVTEGDNQNNASGNTLALTAIFGAPSGSFSAVYFPPGVYWLDARTQTPMKLTFDGITIFGAGCGASTIKVLGPPSQPTGGGLYPFPLVDVNGHNGLCVRDLGFVGTNYGQPGTATDPTQAVIYIDGGSGHKIVDCSFTQNTSYTIYTTADDVQATHCSFSDVGYFNPQETHNYRTDALISAGSANAVRFNLNTMEQCSYGGIQLQGPNGDGSCNYVDDTGSSGLFLNGDLQRSILNCVTNSSLVNLGPGIYAANTTQYIMIGNSVTSQEKDGLSTAGWRNSVLAANNALTDAVSSGDSGIQINPAGTADTTGLVLLGNNAYNSGVDQGAGAGVRGFRFFGDPPPGPMTYTSFVGNNSYKNNINQNTSEIAYDSTDPMGDFSNVVYANFDWVELLHTAGSVKTTSSTKTTLQSLTVPATAILDYRGLRITAGGTTTGTGKSTLLFGFGTSGSIIPGVSWTPAANPSSWQVSIYVINGQLYAAAPHQFVTVVLYADGSMLNVLPTIIKPPTPPVNTQVDTTVNVNVIVEGHVTAGSLSCDFMAVERI